MARDDATTTAPSNILQPQISFIGSVTDCTAQDLRDRLADPPQGDAPIVVEMTTLGGDPEMARRMIVEIDRARERLAPRRLVFLGTTIVYSAGVTFMAAFPREDRFLTRDATLLIHSRQLDKTLEIEGPIRPSIPMVEALLAQLKTGCDLEVKNFQRLIAGSDIAIEELNERALYNWYLPAEEALKRKLVAGLV
jgi:hypothetical protein